MCACPSEDTFPPSASYSLLSKRKIEKSGWQRMPLPVYRFKKYPSDVFFFSEVSGGNPTSY